jgi:type I site-specific restriction endonuclease
LRQINEERTRKEMIDPQLEKAGWYLRDHSKGENGNGLMPVP